MVSSLYEGDIPTETTLWVHEQRQRNRGGWIYGAVGSGKSYAVSRAALGGIRLDVLPGPLLGQRFVSDLARQLGADGRPVLEATRSEGLEAALVVASRAINGHPLVVDSAERLLVEPISLDDPSAGLWQDDKIAIRQWLQGRVEHSPTFLISRRTTGDEPQRYKHHTPVGWEVAVSMTQLVDLDRKWSLLSELTGGNPAALLVARVLALFTSASDFNALLHDADDVEADIAIAHQRLGQAFQSSAPKSWQSILALLAAVGEVPQDVFEAVLGGVSSVRTDVHEPVTDEVLITLRSLKRFKLVEERSGRLSVLPALSAFGAIRSLTGQERSAILPSIAHHLLAPINSIRSLEPEHVDRVLLAHSIFVALGDAGNTERTTALHVHGLVDLARRTSLNERFSEAWQQYESVLRMLGSGDFAVEDVAGRRLYSYVRHYRAWNGFRAGALDDAACLDDYEQAVQQWPENALWHQRVIQTLIRLGRLVEARRAIAVAYQEVEQHPRRDEFLRVRPAWTALGAGALVLSLEFIEPILGASPDQHPELADGCDALLQRWLEGVAFEELTFRSDGEIERSVTLLQPVEVRVRRMATGWVAQARSLSMESRADGPRGAVESLARSFADEARELIGTPTSDLSDKDARRKGLLLSFVDALNSDLGLTHARDRWIVGRLEGQRLIPTLRHLPPVEVPMNLIPDTTEGLYFARVPVHRDGVPSGLAEEIKPAGQGFGFLELVAQLARMNEDAA
jgi:hypothetical protein